MSTATVGELAGPKIDWSSMRAKLGPSGLLFVVALFAFLRPATFLPVDNFRSCSCRQRSSASPPSA